MSQVLGGGQGGYPRGGGYEGDDDYGSSGVLSFDNKGYFILGEK